MILHYFMSSLRCQKSSYLHKSQSWITQQPRMLLQWNKCHSSSFWKPFLISWEKKLCHIHCNEFLLLQLEMLAFGFPVWSLLLVFFYNINEWMVLFMHLLLNRQLWEEPWRRKQSQQDFAWYVIMLAGMLDGVFNNSTFLCCIRVAFFEVVGQRER